VDRRRETGAAWGSVAAGLGSVAAIPVAVYLTRFSDAYDLLHAGFSIPVAAVLGLLALFLSRRATRGDVLGLRRSKGGRAAQVGRVLGVVGICLALAGLVALGVYGLLEYVGSRD
jgi:hypothetical protein